MMRISAAEFLERATIIVRAREKTHGKPEDTHRKIAALWNGYLQSAGLAAKPLKGSDVANLLLLLKIARQHVGAFNEDDLDDVIGYAAVAAEVKSGEQA